MPRYVPKTSRDPRPEGERMSQIGKGNPKPLVTPPRPAPPVAKTPTGPMR